MMKTKKLLALTLSIIMMLSLAMPAFAAEEVPEYPTIYVTGAKTNNIYLDGEKVFPKNVDEMQVIKDALAPCLEKLAKGLVTGNYDEYVDEFYNAMFSDKKVADKKINFIMPIKEKEVAKKNNIDKNLVVQGIL